MTTAAQPEEHHYHYEEHSPTIDADPEIVDLRMSLANNGYWVIPARGKETRVDRWSTFRYSAAQMGGISRKYIDHTNTGFLCGEVVAIDIDVLDEAVSLQIQELALKLPGGDRALVRVGKAPKTLFLFRATEVRKKVVTGWYVINGIDTRVEIMGKGQQIVGFGIHPDTQQPYQWVGASPLDVPFDELPAIDPDSIDAFVIEAEAILAANGTPLKKEPKQERELTTPAIGTAAPAGDGIWSSIKARAMVNLGAWVPNLGLEGLKRYQDGYLAIASFRPTRSTKAGPRKQALEIMPAGICDLSDGNRGYNPVDLAAVCLGIEPHAAADWLRDLVGDDKREAELAESARNAEYTRRFIEANRAKLAAKVASVSPEADYTVDDDGVVTDVAPPIDPPRKVPAAANDNNKPLNIFDWPSSRFVGQPAPTEYLIDGIIEKGIPGMVAAMGEVGKSYSLLEMKRRIAYGTSKFAPPIFGGQVVQEGTAVFMTGEDDAKSMHRRLNALDPKEAGRATSGDKLIIIPMPDAVKSLKPFWKEVKGEFKETDEWSSFCDQLASIRDLRSVAIDPLQLFAAIKINEDPAAGQFVCGSIASLAARTGANIFFAHHMSKGGKDVLDLAGARDAIRGTTALVDGVRVAYALWYGDKKKAVDICKKIGVPWQPNRIAFGGVVKANGAAKRILTTYARNDFGLLVDVAAKLGSNGQSSEDLRTVLVMAVETAARMAHPFTKTGRAGLYEMRERLPEELRGLSKNRMETLAEEALMRGEIVRAAGKGEKTATWLDVPGGDFAIGLGNFTAGSPRR